MSFIDNFLDKMNCKENGLGAHCLLVACLVSQVIKEFPVDIEPHEMFAGAVLHDYGKITWPDELFTKKSLQPADWAIISEHPSVGRKMVMESWPECPLNVSRLIEEHHSPNGWLPAQILAACDVLVACREPRPYRNGPLPQNVILKEMLKIAPQMIACKVLESAKPEVSF